MDIKELRQEIDKTDDAIKELFIKRMKTACKIAAYKKENGVPVLNKSREREIISRVTAGLDEDLAGYTKILYTTLFDLSRSYQSKLLFSDSKLKDDINAALEHTPKIFPKGAVIACQGTEGAYSQLACDKLFSRPQIIYMSSFEGVINAVEKNLCTYGILPIENNLHGSVTDVYDLMKKSNFYIVRSIRLRVSHVLLSRKKTDISKITEIYSHEQAIGQCSEFLAKYPNIKINICENTAVAAKFVSESERDDIAAISSENCAELYGLYTVCDGISNSDNNYTRFICISKKLEIYPGANKISMMFALSHRPGSLYEILAKFSSLGLNMTKLESRPIPGKDFEFMFYLDFDASVYSEEVINLISELENSPEQFTFLGSYCEV